MINRLFIDGTDAFTAFGVFVTAGGYNGLVAYPPLKEVKSNDWPEEDGIEVDLSAPALNRREFAMTFALSGKDPSLGAFIKLLSDSMYHTFEFREIGRTYRLRMVSHTSLRTALSLGLVTLQLADDFPLDGYKYSSPVSTVATCDDYELDGRPLTDYGVRVLEGTLDEVVKSPAVKQNLLLGTVSHNGDTWDGEAVTFSTKDVKVDCLMRAATLNELWRNYNALLHNLVQPGERRLYIDAIGLEYPCYYKDSSVVEFCASGKIWLKFSITLVFTSFRLGNDDYLLAAESGEMFVLEENSETFIDMGYGN